MNSFPYIVIFMMVFTFRNMIVMKCPTKFSDTNYFKRTTAIIWQSVKESAFAGIALGFAALLGPVLAKAIG